MQKQLKNLFIPHKENGFKPNFLERFSMGVMLVLVLLTFAVANIQSLIWIGSEVLVSTILPAVIVELTNDERSGEALTTLRRNALLDSAAKLKAEHMAAHSYFAHYSPDGTSPWYWFDEVGYNYLHAGENLAVHFTDSGDVVDGWMASPSHRANILNGNYSEIGVGTAEGVYQGFPTVYVVQLFGTPRAAQNVAGASNGGSEQSLTLETTGDPDATPDSSDTAVAQASFETIDTSKEPTTKTTGSKTETEAKPETPTEEPITELPNETVVVFSDLATTSRPGVPATTESQPVSEDDTAVMLSSQPELNLLERTATRPSLVLEAIYLVLASLVVVALILSIVIEWRRQYPVQIAYATALLLIMGLLYEIHTALLSGVTIV